MFGGQPGTQGYNTLRQFGSNPQEVRSHIANELSPSATSFAGSPMHAGGTDPRVVQQQIAQDLGYHGGQSNYYGTNSFSGGGLLSQFGTHPQMVQQHIQQDLSGYNNQAGYATGQFGQGSVQQVMQSVPAQIQAHYGNASVGTQHYGTPQYATAQYSTPQYGTSQHYGAGTLAQFGTHPQVVQQHIQNDLQNQVGTITSQQAGGYQGQGGGYYATQNTPNGAFGQFGTNPQVVRQHIQQDLGYYQ